VYAGEVSEDDLPVEPVVVGIAGMGDDRIRGHCWL
jgi:hypothetical protein